MTQEIYSQISILVNAAHYSDDQQVRDASNAVHLWQRTLPEYKLAMERAGQEMDELLAD